MNLEQFVIAFLVYSAVCAVAAGFLAKLKNRSLAEGAGLGLILGIIGVIIEGVLPAKEPGSEPSGGNTKGDKVLCRECLKPWHLSILKDGVCPDCLRRHQNIRLRTSRKQPQPPA